MALKNISRFMESKKNIMEDLLDDHLPPVCPELFWTLPSSLPLPEYSNIREQRKTFKCSRPIHSCWKFEPQLENNHSKRFWSILLCV